VLYGPESRAQQELFHEDLDERYLLDRRTVALRGGSATVTTADAGTGQAFQGGPPGLVTRVQWAEKGRYWTFELTQASGLPEVRNRNEALAAVARLRVPDGRTVDERSLPSGYERVGRSPGVTGRSVAWGATYDGTGTGPVDILAMRVPESGSSALTGAAPGDQILTDQVLKAQGLEAQGRTAVWSPGTHSLTLIRPDGLLLTVRPTGDGATRERAVGIAKTLVPVPADARLRETVEAYLEGLDGTG
jgi:hypothetical protein